MDQVYVKAEDGKQSVAKYLAEVAKANGAFTVKGYVRFETGEGLRRRTKILQQKLQLSYSNI